MIGAEILKQLLKRWMLAHSEKKCILQIFVVKMRTDAEEAYQSEPLKAMLAQKS